MRFTKRLALTLAALALATSAHGATLSGKDASATTIYLNTDTTCTVGSPCATRHIITQGGNDMVVDTNGAGKTRMVDSTGALLGTVGNPLIMTLTGTNNVANTGTFATQSAITAAATSLADGSSVTFGTKADAKASTTDATPITAMSIWKQISFQEQATKLITGDVANGVSDSGSPIKIGGVGVTADPTAVTNGQRVNAQYTVTGKLVTSPYAVPDNYVNGNPAVITTTTATSVIAAQGAGLRIYVTDISITNSHATVGTLVQLTDGSGGSVIWQGYVASAGGGITKTLNIPIRTTANTALFAVCGTTGSSIYISVEGYKAP